MTNNKAWQIVNQCKGFYFSWKSVDEQGVHVFSIKLKTVSYQLVVKSYWKLLYYNDSYFESIDFNTMSNTNFILNHTWNDRIITEISITNTNELRFLLKGKMEFVIPFLTKTKFGYKGLTTPFWEFIKEGEILATSYPQKDK